MNSSIMDFHHPLTLEEPREGQRPNAWVEVVENIEKSPSAFERAVAKLVNIEC